MRSPPSLPNAPRAPTPGIHHNWLSVMSCVYMFPREQAGKLNDGIALLLAHEKKSRTVGQACGCLSAGVS